MKHRRMALLVAVILCLVFIRGVMYGLLIPFDKTPDEKHHFQLIKAKHLQLNHVYDDQSQQVAAEIEHLRYYSFYPEAGPHKRSLQDFAGVQLPPPPSSLKLYYLATAGLLKLLSLEHLRDELYLLRGVSLLCGVWVAGFSFLLARELFPDNVFILLGVPTFITFIPQFSAMNGVVSNDKFTEVFIALLFLIMVKILKYGLNVRYFTLYTLLMVLALLSKRTAIFTLPLFLIFLFVYFWKAPLGFHLHAVLFGLGGLGLIAGGLLVMQVDGITEFVKTYVIWAPPQKVQNFLLHESYSLESLRYYAKWCTVVYWSFWGVFGNMTIHLHHFWYLGIAFAQAVSCGGLVKFIGQVTMNKRPFERWKAKALYLLAMSIVLVVVVMFVRSVILRPGDPLLDQGRRLFTVIGPIGIFTVLGITQIFHGRYLRLAGALSLFGLFMLDVVSLSKYLLLTFHLRSLF